MFAARWWIGAAILAGACQPEVPEPPAEPDLVYSELGVDHGLGNLLGIQAFVRSADYATSDRFERKLRRYFEAARDRNLLRPNTVVVLPEYIGTWLIAADAGPDVFSAKTIGDAITAQVLADPLPFLAAMPFAPATDGTRYAAFSSHAKAMAADYQRVFSTLAHDFAVTLVAGSIVLPWPTVVDGTIAVQPGQWLYNASFVFDVDGQIVGQPVRKTYPTADELSFLAAGDIADLPVVDTPAGRLGVLICADAWYPDAYTALARQGVELIAVPVFVMGDGKWERPWGGYSGQPAPADVNPTDIGAISEHQAWLRYALNGRLHSSGARAALTVPLRGALWDLGDDGQSALVSGGTHGEGPLVDGPALLNLWL